MPVSSHEDHSNVIPHGDTCHTVVKDDGSWVVTQDCPYLCRIMGRRYCHLLGTTDHSSGRYWATGDAGKDCDININKKRSDGWFYVG